MYRILLSLFLLWPTALQAVEFGPRLRGFGAGTAGAPAWASPPTLRLIARGADADAWRNRLLRQGIDSRRIGPVIRIDLPADRLGMLAGPERVLVDLGARMHPLLDVSAPLIAVDDAVRAGREGRDVLVAIIDTGTDFAHPDFRNDDGSTRFVAYWDQSAESRDPQIYGVVCDAVDINRVLLQGDRDACPNNADEPLSGFLPNGHGSHVAGIAAGDDDTYTGIAPGAMLIGVRMLFDEAGLIDALAWVDDVARQLDRPVVINLSLGSNDGPHDGSAPSEQVIDALSGPGRIIVAAAGNEGLEPIHAQFPAGSTVHSARFKALAGFAPESLILELWSDDATDLAVAFALEDDDGSLLAQSVWQTWSGLTAVTLPVGSADDPLAEAEVLAQTSETGQGIRVTLTAASAGLRGNVWHLLVHSPAATADAWLTDRAAHWLTTTGSVVVDAPDSPGTTTAKIIAGDNRETITLPGSARRAITVSGYVSRIEWPTVDGQRARSTRDAAVGERIDIASVGPTRDGRLKPELTAPGEYIVSTMATTIDPLQASTLQQADPLHWVQRGTSMAAPHVSGLVALMLQGNDTLTPEDVLDALTALAVSDDVTGPLPSPAWGFGKVTIEGIEAFEAWRDIRVDTTPPIAADVDARNVSGGVRITWTSDELAAARLTWSGGVTTVMSYGLRGEIVVDTGRAKQAELELVDPAGNWAPPIRVTLPGARGCGCHAGPAAPTDAFGPLLLLVVWLCFRQTVPNRLRPRSCTERNG